MKYPNEYIKTEDYTILRITSEKFGVFDFLIDDEDVERIQQYQWSIFHVDKPKQNKQMIYASTSNKAVPTTLRLLHRFIMNVEKGLQVDHIEGDTFDMRKDKLRICTALENGQNKALSVRGTCGIKGVCWDKRTEKWIAHIRFNYHHKTLGYFDTIEEATECRKQAEIKYQGEFSRDYGSEI